jgi:cell filamentation protein
VSDFDSWESYFYPPPDHGTLRNLFNERDPGVLAAMEYAETFDRARELLAGEVEPARTFDADHVRAIHRHLFQDVYEWAGEYRSIEMAKGVGRPFADARSGEIDQYLGDMHRSVVQTPWRDLGRDDFGERAAVTFAHLNQAHPFREGNGRTAKIFMRQVAEQSNFDLDFNRVDPDAWNQASMLSRPDLYAYEPQPESLVPVFRHIAVERDPRTSPGGLETQRVRSLLSSSYPRPAGAAPEKGPSAGRSDTGYRPGSPERGLER